MAQVAATFTADVTGYQAAMDKMKRSTQGMQGGVGSLASKVSSGMSSIGKVTMAAGAATTAMGVSSLKSYGTFQQSLNKAAVVAGGTSKDIGQLADMANKMGAELPLSAQDAADAMVSMAQDGASIKTITKEFPAIAQAATATGADLQTTAGTVQQAMNVWGDSLKSPTQAAAILTQTANLSNASIEDMSGAISNIGGTAKNAGFGLGDMSESIGLLTNKGFTAQRASQDLNHAILQMMAPSDKARGAMDKLGLSFTDSSGKMKPFPKILKEVAAATDGMTSSQKAAALKTMFNTAGMQAMLPLMDSVKDKSGNTATSWDAYAKAQDGASSSTATATKFLKDQANEMQQNVGSKIEQIGGNWESLRNKSLAAKGGVNSAMVDMINQTITWATESDSSLAQVARGFIGLSPVIGPALTGIGGFITSTGKIIGVASSAVKGIARLGTSAARAAGRLLGAGKAAKTTNSSLSPMAQTTKSSAAAAGASAANFLKMGAAVALVGAGVLAAAAGIALLVQSAISLANAGNGAQVTMVAMAVGIVALAGVFALLGPALTSGAVGIGVFGAAVLAIGTGVAAFGVGVNQVAKAIVLLSGHMSAIVPVMSAMGAGFAAMLTSFITGILTAAPQISAAFINMIVSMSTQLALATPLLVSNFMQMLTGMMTAIATNAPALVASFANMLISLITAVTAQIGPIVAAVTSLIVAMAAAIGANAPQIIAAGIALIGQLAQAFVTQLPLLVQIVGATMAAMVAVIVTYMGKFQELGGIAVTAIVAGFTGKKFDAVGAATDVITSAGAEASKAGQSAFKAAGGNAAIKSAQAIANSKGQHQAAGSSAARAGASGVKSQSGAFNNAGSSNGRSGAQGIKATSGYFTGAGSSIGSAAASGLNGQKGHANSVGRDLGSSSANAVKDGTSGIDLHSNGDSLMGGFLSGLRDKYSAVQNFVSGIAGWIKAHKGPISYDARLLIPAGDAIMTGLNNGLTSRFSDVQKNVSAMAGQLATSINGIAGEIKADTYAMQGAAYTGGDMNNSVDEDNWIKPTFYVHNELVGDKIQTIVNQGQAESSIHDRFFR
ncbi:putative tape measure protein [Lactobacillus phage Silenus]|nr:putative tape measure protein [Lactobacillus phage Silenus]